MKIECEISLFEVMEHQVSLWKSHLMISMSIKKDIQNNDLLVSSLSPLILVHPIVLVRLPTNPSSTTSSNRSRDPLSPKSLDPEFSSSSDSRYSTPTSFPAPGFFAGQTDNPFSAFRFLHFCSKNHLQLVHLSFQHLLVGTGLGMVLGSRPSLNPPQDACSGKSSHQYHVSGSSGHSFLLVVFPYQRFYSHTHWMALCIEYNASWFPKVASSVPTTIF